MHHRCKLVQKKMKPYEPCYMLAVKLFRKTTPSFSNQGNGSSPCPPQGAHRNIRRMLRYAALKTPYLIKASRAYSEQVGVYRHLDTPKYGEMAP